MQLTIEKLGGVTMSLDLEEAMLLRDLVGDGGGFTTCDFLGDAEKSYVLGELAYNLHQTLVKAVQDLATSRGDVSVAGQTAAFFILQGAANEFAELKLRKA